MNAQFYINRVIVCLNWIANLAIFFIPVIVFSIGIYSFKNRNDEDICGENCYPIWAYENTKGVLRDDLN